MKQFGLCLLLIVLSMILIFTGCSNQVSDSFPLDEPLTLTVLIEEFQRDRFQNQIKAVATRLEETYENVDVVFITLSEDTEAREVQLTQLRTEIMAGGGPDVYLLPTGVVGWRLEHLLPDVNQAMRNGLFMDISKLYDADTELGTENLNKSVMDAGVLEGKRFVLPIRYEASVLYASPSQLAARGMTVEELSTNVNRTMEVVIAQQDRQMGKDLTMSLSGIPCQWVFSDWVDYEKNRVLLTKEALVEFLQNYQSLCESVGELYTTIGASLRDYCISEHWTDTGVGFGVDSVSLSIQQAAIAQLTGEEIVMIPFPGVDGKTVASVTHYGAVGKGCRYPKLAYEFLRLFLTEEVQWEENASGMEGVRSLAEFGYPVRTVGSAGPLFANTYNRNLGSSRSSCAEENLAEWGRRTAALTEVVLTDADVPILQAQFDSVHFPVFKLEAMVGEMLGKVSDPITGAPGNVDLGVLADNFLKQLEYHLMES